MRKNKSRSAKPPVQLVFTPKTLAPTKENPNRPEFCPPFHAKSSPTEWLATATGGLNALCDQNVKRYIQSIDREVIAAIYVERELRKSPSLQAAWCELPGWSQVKSKIPKPGVTKDLLAEVFRYHWRVMRNDQDGYELRYNAVKRWCSDERSPEEIVEKIRGNGGYKKSGKKVDSSAAQNHPATSDEDFDFVESVPPKTIASKSPVSSVADKADPKGHKTVRCEVVFEGNYRDATSDGGDGWQNWRVRRDFSQDPPCIHVGDITPG